MEVDAGRGHVVVTSVTDLPILERKGVNLPGVHVDLPHVTAKDEVDIATARSLGADILFASFVQSGAMVREIRKRSGPGIAIVSKIESQSGIDNYEDILAESDGIMVARGDLGVQIPPERVFLAQKRLVARANLMVRERRGPEAICICNPLSPPSPQRAAGQAHHLCDADAGVHDNAPAADARRVRGRGKRGAGRHGRRHAERRDSKGEVPHRGNHHDGACVPRGGGGICTPPLLHRHVRAD